MRTLAIMSAYFFISSTHIQAAGFSKQASCKELLADVQVGNFVTANIAQVLKFPGNWAMATQQIMLSLMVHFKNPNLDFAYFEQFFRQRQAPFYLVANSIPLEAGLTIGYPGGMAELKGSSAPKYYLWVGVHGQEEADQLKRQLMLSNDENLLRLRETGYIFVADKKAASETPNVKMADAKTIADVKGIELQQPVKRRYN